MATLATAALDAAERRTLDRLVGLVQDEFGDRLESIWLYGSRARGERHEESDVDVMVLLTEQLEHDRQRGSQLAGQATQEEGTWGTLLSVQVQDLQWLEGRRAIDSFFAQELDRDRLSLYEKR